MKTKDELSLLKKEYEEVSSKLKELTDEELIEVTGGNNDNFLMEGIAGAYGGSGNTRTATGEIVNDSSMGVAIPISWPNYHMYLGKTILIFYGGWAVSATINDVGVLSGRNLDLQPGVVRSFGFTCAEWGNRSIQYCII